VKTRILSLIILAAWTASCSSSEPSGSDDNRMGGGQMPGMQQTQQQKALSVRAYNVVRRPISNYIVANTTFEAIREVNVYSKLNAIISRLNVEEGDSVRAGQELAHLDEHEIRNEFEQAKIAVDQAKVAVQQAEVRAELSLAEYNRAISLFEQELTSAQEFEQAKLANRTDNLALENARQQLKAARSRLEAAQIQLDYTSIISPINGILTQRLVDVGDRVNVNEQLFTIQEFPPLWARIYVPEKSLPQLHIGQSARIHVETYPDRVFEGRIKLISPTIDAASGTVKVTIEVKQPVQLLRPGMFGAVYIATETHTDAIVIPKKAIIRERDLNFVFVVEGGGTATRKEVQTGFTEEEWVEVVDGLQTGEALVTVGHETLSDGYPVVVQAWEGEAPSETRQAALRPAAESLSEKGQTASVRTAGQDPDQPGRGFAGNRGSGGGPSGKGNREQFFERMLQNPEIKKKWEAKLKEDPSIATDPDKKRAFMREIMAEMRGGRAR